MRVVADTALSRLTFDPSDNLPRFVRRNVSGATPNLNDVSLKEVIVRHVPLMQIESPRWASERRSWLGGVMVRSVPSPEESREVTAGQHVSGWGGVKWGR